MTEKKRPFGCKCETLTERILGDGCDECNKALVIEMLIDERDELQKNLSTTEAALEQMTRDAQNTARDRDEWMTRALVAQAKESK